jgi:KTSC domain-containing protein
MGKIIDVDKVQEALNRAAHKAKHGSRDVRAGRFVAGAASASLPTGKRAAAHRVGAAARTAKSSPTDGRAGRMLPVESSLMTGVAYDEKTRELEIKFTSGKTYRYFDVPEDVYVRLRDANSKGEFFTEEIRDVYEYAEVRERL